MAIIDTIAAFIENLDEKNFYKYLLIGGGILIGVIGIILTRHYYSINSLHRKINIVNSLREDAKRILDKALVVEQQRARVNAIISEDPNFKIGGYMKELLEKLHLTSKKKLEQYIPVDRQDNYRETILTTQLVDMSTQELATLLNEIEQKERVYTKSLDITQSKTPRTIDVTLTIATLQPKEELTG